MNGIVADCKEKRTDEVDEVEVKSKSEFRRYGTMRKK